MCVRIANLSQTRLNQVETPRAETGTHVPWVPGSQKNCQALATTDGADEFQLMPNFFGPGFTLSWNISHIQSPFPKSSHRVYFSRATSLGFSQPVYSYSNYNQNIQSIVPSQSFSIFLPTISSNVLSQSFCIL